MEKPLYSLNSVVVLHCMYIFLSSRCDIKGYQYEQNIFVNVPLTIKGFLTVFGCDVFISAFCKTCTMVMPTQI